MAVIAPLVTLKKGEGPKFGFLDDGPILVGLMLTCYPLQDSFTIMSI